MSKSSMFFTNKFFIFIARMAAYSHNRTYIDRYFAYLDGLTTDINDAMRLSPPSIQAEVNEKTNIANDKLVVLETRSFDLFDAGNFTQAAETVTGYEYLVQKDIYAQGMNILFNHITNTADYNKKVLTTLSIIVLVLGFAMIPIIAIVGTICCFIVRREITFVSELAIMDTLSTKSLRKAFIEYAKKEHSDEHVLCWLAIEEYKHIATDEGRLAKAKVRIKKKIVCKQF